MIAAGLVTWAFVFVAVLIGRLWYLLMFEGDSLPSALAEGAMWGAIIGGAVFIFGLGIAVASGAPLDAL